MKRSNALVEYARSDSDNDNESPPSECQTTLRSTLSSKRRRKLPQLSSSLVVPAPTPDPSKHQGRIRSKPHVEGQYAAHIYVPVTMATTNKNETSSFGMQQLLRNAAEDARRIVPSLNSDWLLEGSSKGASGCTTDSSHLVSSLARAKSPELHISLSRPIYIRRYQNEDIKRAARRIALSHKPFTASFASFATFDNDECTRTFMGIEVGAGHDELKGMSDALSPTLKLLHQQTFYSEPRFHASFAWALLGQPSHNTTQTTSNLGCTSSTAILDFPTIPSFPDSLLRQISADYGAKLAKLGVFEVTEVRVKLGKEEYAWSLSG